MEAHVASTEDQLVPGLSYKLPSAANYIHSRTSVTQWPLGGNQHSPNGVRLMRFHLSDGMSGGGGGGSFLDPSTLRLAYTIKNLDNSNPMKMQANSPVIFFQRMRILLNGTLVEDISYLGRLQQMLDIMLPTNRRLSHTISGFGQLTSTANQNFGKGTSQELLSSPLQSRSEEHQHL